MESDRPAREQRPAAAAASGRPSRDDCATVAEAVKAQDLDAWLAGLLVPAPLQPRHWALWGLVTDVLAVPWKVSEPALGLVRLQWWLDELGAEEPVQHPLCRLVHAELSSEPALRSGLGAFIEATAAWLAEPFHAEGAEAWLGTAETLALKLVNEDDGASLHKETEACLKALGRAWGCAMLLRRAPHVRRNGLPLLCDRSVAMALLEEGHAALQRVQQGRAGMRDLHRGQKALLRAFSLSLLWLQAVEKAFRTDAEKDGKAPLSLLAPPSQAARQWRLLLMWLTDRLA